MKILEISESVDKELPFDIVEDVIVFMRNDPMFYRKQFFPAISKIADQHRSGKEVDSHSALGDVVEQALNGYCKKFNIANIPDELFSNDDRYAIIDRVFSEEMEQIKSGEYQ